ncbi:hypothetical protein Sjap_017628 [Stephania japonica]|uniref:Uncharacterized protein n=1 Tax=Stephania japonica TaxID=461633 RepID=A0AAP0NJP0_9MAGN
MLMASIYELMASPSFDWKTTPLLECPSIYELMASPSFDWKTTPLLEIWEGSTDAMANPNYVVYNGVEVVAPFNLDILKWANETHGLLSYAKLNTFALMAMELFLLNRPRTFRGDCFSPISGRDGLKAVARVGVPGDHRGLSRDRHVFRILKHWLKADHDPYYNPMNDYVILPTAFDTFAPAVTNVILDDRNLSFPLGSVADYCYMTTIERARGRKVMPSLLHNMPWTGISVDLIFTPKKLVRSLHYKLPMGIFYPPDFLVFHEFGPGLSERYSACPLQVTRKWRVAT